MGSHTKECDVSASEPSDCPTIGNLQHYDELRIDCPSKYNGQMVNDGAYYTADDPKHTVEPKTVRIISEILDQEPPSPDEDLTDTSVKNSQRGAAGDDAADDPTLATKPINVCGGPREKQPTTTSLTSADLSALEEMIRDLLDVAVERALSVSMTISPSPIIVEQSSSVSPIAEAKSDSDDELEPATTTAQENLAATEIPLLRRRGSFRLSLSAKYKTCKRLYPVITEEISKCVQEHLLPDTQHVLDEMQQQPCTSSAIISKCVPEHLLPDTQHVLVEMHQQPCTSSAMIDVWTPMIVHGAEVTEQFSVNVTPVRDQLLDTSADDNDLVADEAAESTVVVAVAKSDGDDEPEPAMTTGQVNSAAAAAAEKPRQGRRRSCLSALGRRLLKFGRTLLCCGFNSK